MVDPKGPTVSWRFDAVTPSLLSQLKEIWQFRDLFPALFLRSLFLIRQKAILGIFWVVVRVVAIALPVAFLVGQVLKFDTDQLPPSIFILSGFAAWMLFRECAMYMMKALALHKLLVERFNIPPLLLIASITSVGLFAFVIVNLIMLVPIVYHWLTTGTMVIAFGPNLLAAVPTALMILLLALGVSCFTAIFGYVLADTILAMRYIFTAWMLASPVFYSPGMFDSKYRFWFYLNPLAGPIETYRWSLFRTQDPDWANIALSFAIGIAVLLAGMTFFLKLQRRFLDFD